MSKSLIGGLACSMLLCAGSLFAASTAEAQSPSPFKIDAQMGR